jgi:hypothetical protein
MNFVHLPLALGLSLLMVSSVVAEEATLPVEERQKIEKLIDHVKELKDTVFIRNGVEYDAVTAAKFLKGKWDANAGQIKSAREFVEKAATASSTTGKPYLIRFKQNGAPQEVPSGDYLLEQLRR